MNTWAAMGASAVTLLCIGCDRSAPTVPTSTDGPTAVTPGTASAARTPGPASASPSAAPAASASAPAASASAPAGAAFVPYPGSRSLCGGHVSGGPGPRGQPGPHITWSAFHSEHPPAQVVAHYVAALGELGHERQGDEDLWRAPPGRPERVLTIAPASAHGPWDECSPPRTGTVILLSSMARAD